MAYFYWFIRVRNKNERSAADAPQTKLGSWDPTLTSALAFEVHAWLVYGPAIHLVVLVQKLGTIDTERTWWLTVRALNQNVAKSLQRFRSGWA